MERLKSGKVLLAALACVLGPAAHAATYTYEFDATFGQYYNPFLPPFTASPGGTITGSFTIDDTLNVTAYALETTDHLGGTRSYSDSDTGDTGSFAYTAPAGGLPAFYTFTFTDSDPDIRSDGTCNGAALSLTVAGDFDAGDEFAIAPIQTRELLRCTNLSFNRDQVVLGSGQSATLAPVSAVPLPASLPLLLAGIGGIAMFRRKKRA